MNKTYKRLLALLLATASTQAFALGLGAIVVKSQLDEPLVAEIPVIGASGDEASGLQARLATAAELDRAGLDASRASAPVDFEVVNGRDGRSVIRVTTRNAVHDPVVSFLVEVNWASGRLLREYRVTIPSSGGAPGTVTQAAPEAERAAPLAAPSESKTKAKAAEQKSNAAAAPAKAVAAEPKSAPAKPAEPKSNAAPAPAKAVAAEPKSAPAKPAEPAPKPVAVEAKRVETAKPAEPAPKPIAPKATEPAPKPVAQASEPKPLGSDAKAPVAAPKPAPAAPPAPAATPASNAVASSMTETPAPAPSKPAPPPPASPASADHAAPGAELDRAKADLAAKESDTAALKARIAELERSQPQNRERLEEENRKLADAERQLNQLAREASEQQQALARVQSSAVASTATDAAPSPAVPPPSAPADTGAANPGTEPATAAGATDAAPGDVAEATPPPRPERSAFDDWLVPGALALVALFVVVLVFANRRKRQPLVVAPPLMAGAEIDPAFDALEPLPDEGDVPVPAAAPASSGDSESQLEMLRLFYLRGDSAGFEDTAYFVREQNPDPVLWRRIAEMGRMLAPENPLYADPDAPRASYAGPDLDLPAPAESLAAHDSLHEAMFESGHPTPPPPPAAPAPVADEPDWSAPLEHHADAPMDSARPEEPAIDEATVAMPSLPPVPEALSEMPAPVESTEPEPAPAPEPPPAPPPRTSATGSAPGDPVDTKLELAEAYLEMGDAEAAREMLDEVMDEGDSRQKAEALRLRAEAGSGPRKG